MAADIPGTISSRTAAFAHASASAAAGPNSSGSPGHSRITSWPSCAAAISLAGSGAAWSASITVAPSGSR